MCAFDDCPNISGVYYEGTESDWQNINISAYNYNMTNAGRLYYSETDPGETGYWHYDENGNVVFW